MRFRRSKDTDIQVPAGSNNELVFIRFKNHLVKGSDFQVPAIFVLPASGLQQRLRHAQNRHPERLNGKSFVKCGNRNNTCQAFDFF